MEVFFHALILGIVQGIAEFLPISSSAHLILVSYFQDGQPLSITLNVALHCGTLAAVLVYFREDWTRLVTSTLDYVRFRKISFDTHTLLPCLLIGSIPGGLIGVLFEHQIEAWFHHPYSTLAPLVFFGVLLWATDRYLPVRKTLNKISFWDAWIIGCWQALALVPGVSRSGASMTAARIRGFDRMDAAKFSFLLGTPLMFGAALKSAPDIIRHGHEPAFFVGTVASMIVGLLTIKFLLVFLQKYNFAWFAAYRVLLAVFVFVVLRFF